MSTTTRREREKKARREAILDAAEAVVLERGVFQTTMEEVAAGAELSKGALYLYFANKDALYAAIAERAITRFLVQLRPALAEPTTGLEHIRRILQAHVRFFGDRPDYVRLAVSWMIGGQQADHDSPSFQAYRRRVGEVVGLVVQALDEGRRDGSIRPDIDPLPTALSLWGTFIGAKLLTLNPAELASRVPYPLDTSRFEPMAIEFTVRALRAQPPEAP